MRSEVTISQTWLIKFSTKGSKSYGCIRNPHIKLRQRQINVNLKQIRALICLVSSIVKLFPIYIRKMMAIYNDDKDKKTNVRVVTLAPRLT